MTLTLWILNIFCCVILQHVKVLDVRKLQVVAPGDRSKIHFDLHSLKNLLPLVVVIGEGHKIVERDVIAEKKNDKQKDHKEKL
ncbi:putative DNA-directed RNA polymerase III largest subunit [Corchorus olitorius]|uniref:DNA-directed RNA polymerase III largest subunit n=1 Tax=Corchorus olitorius TaxID=93759 RepID=A0A1R3GG38_9ROSI|nr:putative DNA-directed RNA polymerase III largest subunit [Corchorus olitorius]